MRRVILVFVGMLFFNAGVAAELDFVPDSLKSFVSDNGAMKYFVVESGYYKELGLKIEGIRKKYPKEFIAENYLDYFDELNALLIEVKKNHRHVEDRIIDDINVLRQQWFDALTRSALKEAVISYLDFDNGSEISQGVNTKDGALALNEFNKTEEVKNVK